MGALSALLEHPDEIVALLKLKFATSRIDRQVPRDDADLRFCYSMLQRVSRSFAIVIQQLGTELRDAICIFYLVLRALDTVEDDMSIPVDDKLPVLKTLYKSIYDPSFRFPCGDKDYKVLMDNFHHLSQAFLKLAKRYQTAIEEITNKMGHGMAKYICKEVETIEDYDEYCHYVAGLVGYGLSRLFHASGLEDLAPDDLSNSMGLFLQKTNIIRDYLEDINEIPRPRMFWPKEVWGKYASKLEDLKEEENSEAAVKCLNELVTNALTHVPDCLKYLSALRDHAIFRFCAIPQIMAIGTLALCYDNINVFRGVVKLRRGLTAKIMDETHSMKDVYRAFSDFNDMIALKINKNDPSAQKMWDNVETIRQACRASGYISGSRTYSHKSRKVGHEALLLLLVLLVLIVMLYMAGQRAQPAT